MVIVFYACLVLGAALLLADMSGRLLVNARRLRLFQWIGIAAASGPGLGPLIAWLTGRLEASWPFPLIAFTYAAAFVVFAIGILRLVPEPRSTWLRRGGYLVILLVAALPSWVLLYLAPLVALAGVGLARPEASA